MIGNVCQKCAHQINCMSSSRRKLMQFLLQTQCLSPQQIQYQQKCSSHLYAKPISSVKNGVVSADHGFLMLSSRGYRILGLGDQTNGVSKAVSDAEKIVGYPTSFLSLRCLLSDELSNVALHMRKLVGTKHPLLKTARGLVFDGKSNLQMRGLIVMLISKAAGPSPGASHTEQDMISGVYPSQRSLAEITEVIHTAGLIHKGVVNLDEVLPEDGPLPNMEFGNRMAVLSGDYLLASACTGLAKLGNPSVVEEVASSIGEMMKAEFTNFTDASGQPQFPSSCSGFSDWLKQTYLSVGSLLAKSCQSAMTLAAHSEYLQQKAFDFGKNTIYAYQLCQDILPFLQREEQSSLTLTSAPIYLYRENASTEEFSYIQQLWAEGPSSYNKVISLINKSRVLEQCIEECTDYRNAAISALDSFSDSEAKDALINMVTVMSDIR